MQRIRRAAQPFTPFVGAASITKITFAIPFFSSLLEALA
jgi:hypothetical protein